MVIVSPMKQLSNPTLSPLELRDGRMVHIRPLERTDRAALAAAIARLSDESRYLRFATAKPMVSARELDYLVDVDHHDREALLAIDPVTGDTIAVVHYVQVSGEPGAVEVAITVADEWQGRGLGAALLAALLRRAGDEGHAVALASVLAINTRSIAMLRRAGFRARGGDGLLREYQRPLKGLQAEARAGMLESALGPSVNGT